MAKSLGVYPWILIVLLLAAFVCAVTGVLRRKSYDARRIYSSLRKKLWLDAFTRYCLEIYLRLTHQSLAVVVWLGVSMSPIVFSIHAVALVMCVALPIAMTIAIARNRSKLDLREYKVKWGTLYNGIRTTRNASSQYSSVFLWRRLFYVLIVVLLYKFDYFRIQIFIITQTLFLIYLGYARAHSYNLYNGIDLFNEYMILWAGYYMIINTDYMPDLAVRYWLGWTAVLIYCALFLINLLIVVVIFVSELKHAVKMHRLKKQFTV